MGNLPEHGSGATFSAMRLSLLLGLLLAAFTQAPSALATIDVGIQAHLLAVAGPDDRYAIVLESSVQEGCDDVPCSIYAVDTHEGGFPRAMRVELPARMQALEQKLCRDLNPAQCGPRLVAARQADTEEPVARNLSRYLQSLKLAERHKLKPLKIAPDLQRLKAPEQQPATHRLSFYSPRTKRTLHLQLAERWTVPSFRAVSGEQSCNPRELASCRQVVRWLDGQRSMRWACPLSTCAGRASVIRPQAAWRGQKPHFGNSTLVEPGALVGSHRGLVEARAVPVASLQVSGSSVTAFSLPRATLIVGGFAHGMYTNGTWFPLVVVVPQLPKALAEAPGEAKPRVNETKE